MKLPAYSSRSRFYQGLRKQGLTPGQIQHIQTLYNQDKSREAAKYMRQKGITEYRRRETRRIRKASEDLRTRAADAKRRKLGRVGDISRALESELRQMIELNADELRDLASNQRAHNPFWYHQRRSYMERLSVA